MAFARQRQAEVVALDVREAVLGVALVLRPDFDAAGVKLAVDCPATMILADEDMLRQVLVNLLLNSLHASSAGGRVTVTVERRAAHAVLTVRDRGSGIAPELLPNVFKPYVAGRPDGHGLGLAIVKRIVEEHGWTVRVDSTVGEGTTVTIAGLELTPQQEHHE
jgi:signal transduction histidine kinase